ncbi:serine hydrolase domain-containing protein [Methylomonas sp. MK1]|uniref:serine hydrolase domain-containing protein n=1 Tax=Methylomonas sp. MK1 TaxID=1131552 RepID=UPI000366BAD0|nr:serine hydrolase domain-containing protein [Methylomonas sp. MK1]
MKTYLTYLSAILLLLSGCAGSPPLKPDNVQRGDYSYLKAHLSWLIEQEMSEQDVEGLSIAVVDDQQVVWSQGFGYADQARQIAATPETVYRVGSVSKLFTDTLVMQLAEQGKLDIDQPLQTYLPNFAIKSRFPDAGPITARNVMTHHSGLPGDRGNGMWTKTPAPFSQLVGKLKDEYVAYPPNRIWAYSNLGITLLGAMLERLTGQDFSSYADWQLLKPLGMTNAAFSLGIEGELASKAYKNDHEQTEVALRDMPAGGLNANVLDLSRFIAMVLADGKTNGRLILKPETLHEMLRQQNQDVALDVGTKTGLGWFLTSKPGIGEVAAHGGATLFHRSLLTVAPEHKLGVVLLANSPPTGDLIDKVTDKALKLAVAIKTGMPPPEETETPVVETRGLTPQEQQLAAGHYATALGYIKLTADGDTLSTELNGNSMDLVGRADGKFGIRYKLLGLIPLQPKQLAEVGVSVRHVDGHDLALAHWHGQTFVLGEKIQPVAIPDSMRSRLGEYEIVNLAEGAAMVPEKCALRERDGFLMLEYSIPTFDMNNLTFPIAPVSENAAVILGLGRGMQETVRLETINGQDFVAYSGYLLRKK